MNFGKIKGLGPDVTLKSNLTDSRRWDIITSFGLPSYMLRQIEMWMIYISAYDKYSRGGVQSQWERFPMFQKPSLLDIIVEAETVK